jgi:GT2 family glycosyltransferase
VSVPVTIVIPVFNGREWLEKLLASIARQTVAPLEIIVVDNGSTDGAPDSARRAGARVIAMGTNTGFAAAVNRGIQEAKGEGIALINSDVELDSAWLETLWTGACDNAVDFATGRILQAAGDTQADGDTLDGSYDLICRGGCPWRAGAGKPDSVLSRTARPIQFCSATAAIYHAELFRKVGLFEEKFESYLEDVDFGLRCASAGRKGGYFPDAVCRHLGSATFGRWHPRVVRLIARNQVFLIARHYPRGLIRRWLWPILVAQTLWGGLAFRHGCGIAWLRGKLEAVGRFAAIRRTSMLSGVPSLATESAIVESEQQIHHLQSAAGFDAYWKLYFRLAGSAK